MARLSRNAPRKRQPSARPPAPAVVISCSATSRARSSSRTTSCAPMIFSPLRTSKRQGCTANSASLRRALVVAESKRSEGMKRPVSRCWYAPSATREVGSGWRARATRSTSLHDCSASVATPRSSRCRATRTKGGRASSAREAATPSGRVRSNTRRDAVSSAARRLAKVSHSASSSVSETPSRAAIATISARARRWRTVSVPGRTESNATARRCTRARTESRAVLSNTNSGGTASRARARSRATSASGRGTRNANGAITVASATAPTSYTGVCSPSPGGIASTESTASTTANTDPTP